MKIGLSIILVVMFVAVCIPAQACTTFWQQFQGRSFVAKNYDWNEAGGLVLINKRGVKKQSLTLNLGNRTSEWTSKYASLTFNQYGREMPNGGMNTEGLVVEVMWFNQTLYQRADERPSISELQWIQYQLDRFSTTAEVIEHASKLRIAPIYAKVHYLVCDKSGHCAAFEYVNHKLVISKGAKALSNSSYADSMGYLNHLGRGGPKGDLKSSLNRFLGARRHCLSGAKPPFEVLNQVRQGDFTKWQIVYEPSTLTIRFRTTAESAIKTVQLKSFDTSCKAPVLMLNINTRKKGDVTAAFTAYSADANYALLQETTKPLQKHLPPGAVWLLSRYPKLTQCTQ